MDGIVYITLDQAKDIHRKTIQYSGGGTYEHFDLGRLDSVLQNIQNDDYYPTFEDKLPICSFAPANSIALQMGTNDWLLHSALSSCCLTDIWQSLNVFLLLWKTSVTTWLQVELIKICFIEL